jgi:hypothetical protein
VSQPEVTPVTAWSGWDVRGGAVVDATEAFGRSVPDESGAGEAYELIAVAARGFRPPRFMSTSALPGATGGDHEEPDRPGLRLTWSLLYRRVAETGPSLVTPYGIYLLGVNPPADATDADLADFNDFYTNVHMPEVAERRHALRAVRYEAGASNRRHSGPPYSAGPDVWQRHTTPWRLWYRRLDPTVLAT